MKEMQQTGSGAVLPTHASVRQLEGLRGKTGPTMGFIQAQLARYITAHEQAGCALDTGGQALRFDDRLSLFLKKLDGVWQILRVWCHSAPLTCQPVMRWQCVKRGFMTFIAKVLVGWRYPARKRNL